MKIFEKDQSLELLENGKVIAKVTVASVYKDRVTIKDNDKPKVEEFLFKEETGHWYLIFNDPFQIGQRCIDYNFPYDFKIK